jgi:putative ABC transport system permease protein
MYFRILKKDLKRKRTMNIILLIFIILASTFISSSVNNIISITSATESYFKKAEIKDYFIVVNKDEKSDEAFKKFLNSNKYVEGWSSDEFLFLSDSNIKKNGNQKFVMINTGMVTNFDIKQQKFFDRDNNEIKSINSGEIYMPINSIEENNLKTGDKITITNGNVNVDFTLAGNCKDAALGSSMMGTTRFIISNSDYLKLTEGNELKYGNIYSIETNDIKKFSSDLSDEGLNMIASFDRDTLKITYVMDMIIAGILLVVSICLILISIVILRFTIVFTLNEEFREIGIMKAIGIKKNKIRFLYIVKYLAISVIGSTIGLFLSIPFGNMFLNEISKNFIITTSTSMFFVNFICSVLIVGIILLFCYTSTRKVNKFTPVDAIRNGSNGERYKAKGIIRLSKVKMSAVPFMAVNDILSGLRRFTVLLITFIIGVILIIVPVNSINTLSSDQLVKWFGMSESDLYLLNEKQVIEFMDNGYEFVEKLVSESEQKLKDKGIDADVYVELMYRFKISHDDKSVNSLSLQGVGISTDKYLYTEGTYPKYENEVALTHITADKIDAKIGDKVKIKMFDTEKEFVVTAIYQSMNNLGEGIRFSENADIDYLNIAGAFAVQIKYKDDLTEQQKEENLKIVKELFPEHEVMSGGEYINQMIGNIAEQLEGTKELIIIVIMAINVLVVFLITKTFITKEKGEIGMLKSIGFKNSSIILWQTLRIGIVMIMSIAIGLLLSGPITQFSAGKVFEMMGASKIDFVIKPLEVYLIYPLVILICVMIASVIALQQVRRISAQETNNIE